MHRLKPHVSPLYRGIIKEVNCVHTHTHTHTHTPFETELHHNNASIVARRIAGESFYGQAFILLVLFIRSIRYSKPMGENISVLCY